MLYKSIANLFSSQKSATSSMIAGSNGMQSTQTGSTVAHLITADVPYANVLGILEICDLYATVL